MFVHAFATREKKEIEKREKREGKERCRMFKAIIGHSNWEGNREVSGP